MLTRDYDRNTDRFIYSLDGVQLEKVYGACDVNGNMVYKIFEEGTYYYYRGTAAGIGYYDKFYKSMAAFYRAR